MKDLPDTFQFRDKRYPAYTHTAERNDKGGYDIKWARRWERVIHCHNTLDDFGVEYVEACLKDGTWIIADGGVKKDVLPDEFKCRWGRSATVYRVTNTGSGAYEFRWSDKIEEYSLYASDEVRTLRNRGIIKILDKRPLTPEQQKFVKEMKEQVMALESSIKLNEQDITHKQRLIASYNERKDVLLGKINEMEG